MTDMAEGGRNIPLRKEIPLRKDRNFRWLVFGGALSSIGDQLTMVALPWLVLSLTRETWVLGTVLLLIGLPKAAFILLGGAIVDRFSPKAVMLYSKCVNGLILLLMAYLIFNQQLSIPILCGISFLLGISGAFSVPARSAILPAIVGRDRLEKANSFFMVLSQVTLIAGPLIAGVILGTVSETKIGNDNAGSHALALLFGLDGLTYVISTITLALVKYPSNIRSQESGVLASIGQGLQAFWRNTVLRALIFYVAIASCVVGGLLQLGLPVLVRDSLLGGGDSFGYLLAVSAFGATVGVIISATNLKLGGLSLGVTFLLVDMVVGFLIMGLGSVHSLSSAFAIIFAMGLLGGYIHVGMISWVQRQVPPDLLGRMMSIIIFVTMGLVPISAAIFGVLLKYVLVGNLFIIVGLMLSVIAAVGLTSKELRSIRRNVAQRPAA